MGNNSSYENILKDATSDKEKSILFNFSKTYPAYIILIVTLGLSFYAQFFVEDVINSKYEVEFEKAIKSVETRIKSKFETKYQILTSIDGIFKNSYVVRDVFELNSKTPISTYPSIRAIYKISQVNPEEFDEYFYDLRSQGYYDLNIHPKTEKEDYLISEYVVPFKFNKDRSGFDFNSDERILGSVKNALISGKIEMTPVYNVRPDTLGFYILKTIYDLKTDDYGSLFVDDKTEEERKNNYSGAILLELDVNKFYTNAIGEGIATDSSIVFEIIDTDTQNKTAYQVYQSGNYHLIDQNYEAIIDKTITYNEANHDYQIRFMTAPNFGSELDHYLPLLTLIGAILTSFILFAFIISVITSKTRAQNLADSMTRSQRRILDASQDMIAVLDFDGVWKSMNSASTQIFHISSDDIVGKRIDDLFVNPADTRHFYRLLETDEEDFTEIMDLYMVSEAGHEKWINWSFNVSKTDQLVYCIGRDVTSDKEAEKKQIIRNKQVKLAEQFAKEANESKAYFMTKLSHHLRNSLTGILGYLQLVDEKVYETEEEHDEFIKLAESSSEEIFTYVNDILDMSSDKESNVEVAINQVGMVMGPLKEKFKKGNRKGKSIVDFELLDESHDAKFVANRELIDETLVLIFNTLAVDLGVCSVQINAMENSYEKATEIQFLGSENPLLERMIPIYKEHKVDIIDTLEKDFHDVLLNLAVIESNIRRLNGSFGVETFGGEDGNVFMITLPLSPNSN